LAESRRAAWETFRAFQILTEKLYNPGNWKTPSGQDVGASGQRQGNGGFDSAQDFWVLFIRKKYLPEGKGNLKGRSQGTVGSR